jgi:polysaccharide pyruvyl transferase WcaK-like protein
VEVPTTTHERDPVKLEYDPKNLISHIGEALGLLLVAIAQEHDAPDALLEAVTRAERKAEEHRQMYSPETTAMLRYARKSLESALEAWSARQTGGH